MNLLTFQNAALVLCAVAAFTDFRSGRIPNVLTLPALVLGFALHAALGRASLVSAALGLGIVGGAPALLHFGTRGAAIGGGDVKLFAALGVLLGPTLGLEVELSSFIWLAAFAMVRLLLAGRLFRVLKNTMTVLANPLLAPSRRRALDPEALTEMRLGPAVFVALVGVSLADRIGRAVSWLG